MAAATDELMLLERVFLCLGNADTDEQLQASVCKFLPPVLLKLSSPQEGVRKKVMGLLVHINKRVKSRPKVQLPVEALLLQYQDPAASSFVINFTIIYIKLGYPRMEMKKQAELLSIVLNAIEGKPLSHQDSLLLMVMPALGHIDIPSNPEKRAALLGLQEKPYVTKQLMNFMLDMLLLPYGSIGQVNDREPGQSIDWSQYPVPSGLSEYSFKRVIGDNPPTAEQLEKIKLGIVKFVSGGFFPESDILVHLIVAAADTRFGVANLADTELKKVVTNLDWSSMELAVPLYTLYLGNTNLKSSKNIKPEHKRQSANTRIRLKLLHYLCRVTGAGFIISACVALIFDTLYGNNTSKKLKSLALDFTLKMVKQCNLESLSRVAMIIHNGMIKFINDGELEYKMKAYTVVGQLGSRIPDLVKNDFRFIGHFFKALADADGDMKRTIRDTLVTLSSALVLNPNDEVSINSMIELLSICIKLKAEPSVRSTAVHYVATIFNPNDEVSINSMIELLSICIKLKAEPSVRSTAVHYVATIFPPNHIPSRYLLLVSCGDEKNEVSSEAIKALYGTAYRNERNKSDIKAHLFPDFPEIIVYLNEKAQKRLSSTKTCINIGNHTLPYNLATLNEIINYLRLCLAKSAKLPLQEGLIENHPCEYTPMITRYWKELLEQHPEYLDYYLELVTLPAYVTSDIVPLTALLELVGTIPPSMTNRFVKDLPWIKTLLGSKKADIRELAAKIHAIVTTHNFDLKTFESQANELISLTSNRDVETQHGALFALSYMMERKLVELRYTENLDVLLSWPIYSETIKTICSYLKSNIILLSEAVVQGIGVIGKVFPLPLSAETTDERLSTKQIVEHFFAILNNPRLNHKIKEIAVQSLGSLCIQESFVHTKYIVEKFIDFAKETKNSVMHFTIAEALVLCIQKSGAKEARDIWKTLPDEYKSNFSQESDNLLVFLLDRLLKLACDPHPNSRQAICIWLIAILRHNGNRKQVMERLIQIQNVFMNFLAENNELVQDVASKGICLVYDSSDEGNRDTLISNLLIQLSDGRRSVQQVTSDTKLFEEGQLGKAPGGGNITTYKEICSLASDLNKPDLIYKFLHLANHNAVWTSKKGAAYGFSAIASIAKDELNKHLPRIIPKLYRYQFDPTPKIQQSMASIWHAIVPSTQKILEQYHNEILDDLTLNLVHSHWRVRISCCNALANLLKSSAAIDYEKRAPELWNQLFRVMDDIHEETRNIAINTAKLFSKVCISQCNIQRGKSGEKVLQAILPILLNVGILHTVGSVRQLSLQTVAQLVSNAGILLKPSLVNLIPALLAATDIENTELTYLSTKYGGQQAQEIVDNMRVNVAKNHYATETIKKCTQYIDALVLKELMPKIIELIKSSIGLGSKVSISYFLVLLSSQLKQELQPYAGKILHVLMNSLLDRNGTIRKTSANTIGHIVGSAKDSSLEKLFNTLNTWYMEKEDDFISLAIGQTLQSISNNNHDVINNFSDIVIPLIFFAMHTTKTPENKNTIELWTELWTEIVHDTESAIKQNLIIITEKLRNALESPSWTIKAQAANAISTIALKIGSSIDENSRTILLNILIVQLQGKIWNGKEYLVNALAALACNNNDALILVDNDLTAIIIDALYKESKKNNIEYRRYALKAFADVLHQLKIDRFTQLYDIAQEILVKMSKKSDNTDDNNDANDNSDSDDGNLSVEEITNIRENKIKLQETVYDALGKAWPSSLSSKDTQDKYCLQFVAHCCKILPNSTRTIQVAIMTTLKYYVEKLIILQLKYTELTNEDKKKLNQICKTFYQILTTAVNIPKYTKIRKEALNIGLILAKNLIENENTQEIESLKSVFYKLLPELTQDNQPEIRTRVIDIKAILKIQT